MPFAYRDPADYKQITDSIPSVNEQLTRPIRICPISGIDITHQGALYPFVTAKTPKQLFKTNRPQFGKLMAKFNL